MDISPTGESIALACIDDSIRLLKLAPYRNYKMKRKRTSRHITELSHDIKELRISKSGNYICTIENSGQLIWDALKRIPVDFASYEEIAKNDPEHSFNHNTHFINGEELNSPDGKYLITIGSREYTTEHRALFFRFKEKHSYRIAKVEEVSSEQQIGISLTPNLKAITFNKDGSILACVDRYDSRTIEFYDVSTWSKLPYSITLNDQHGVDKLRIDTLLFNPRGTLLIAIADSWKYSKLYFWKVQ